ncbi:hypothetical protein [Glycomyces xiaoerkulensis]|uniref:hypothetical protein n=1 Tax=Glycomyces xiaoerkulensis TaxID=2038139 RepID=UPI000C263AD1|nr:hypothetical protein [Glycomyces xiaoerkulensis]
MTSDETEPAPDNPGWWALHRHAATAALGNATALGLGFAYLRRWPQFGTTLFVTGVLALIIRRSEPPPPPFWFVAVGLVALTTAIAAWRAADFETAYHRYSKSPGPLPGRGRFWLPAFVAVLAAYAGAYGWIVLDAERRYDAQTDAHARGDCAAAVAEAEHLHWGHHALATDRYDAIRSQAMTCGYYLDAVIEDDEFYSGSEKVRIDAAIRSLETHYLQRHDALLHAEAEQRILSLQVDLVLATLVDYADPVQRFDQALADVQALVAAEPDDPLAERALTGLEDVADQWREDISGNRTACLVFAQVESLTGPDSDLPAEVSESGPLVAPMLEQLEGIRPDAAFACAGLLVESSEFNAESDPERSESQWERAIDLLQMLVDEYPNRDLAAEAEAMLQELET